MLQRFQVTECDEMRDFMSMRGRRIAYSLPSPAYRRNENPSLKGFGFCSGALRSLIWQPPVVPVDHCTWRRSASAVAVIARRLWRASVELATSVRIFRENFSGVRAGKVFPENPQWG